MTSAGLVGAGAIVVPLLTVLWLLFRRNRAIWWFACALLVVGMGYLVATGAAHDIGQRLVPSLAAKRA